MKNNETAAVFDQSHTKELLAAGKALGQPITVSGREPVFIVPEGFRAETLPPLQLPPLPDHIRQAVTLRDAASFVGYVNRYKLGTTLIFATLPLIGATQAEFTAFFDYHNAPERPTGTETAGPSGPSGPSGLQLFGLANRCAHQAKYPCPLAPEWLAWTGIDQKAQTQHELITFLEENAPDLLEPDAATMLELITNFEAQTQVKFTSKVDRATGGRVLHYSEDVDAGSQVGQQGKVKVPTGLKISIPVFEGSDTPKYEIGGRLVWEPRDGRLKVTVKLNRPYEVLRQAFDETREVIAQNTGIRPLTGAVG